MTTDYLLGDADPELRRLAAQHLVWSEVTHAGWRMAPVRQGDRVLDVGCGPGFTTLELADWVGPQGQVTGIDPSSRFTGHLREQARLLSLEHVEVIDGTVDAMPPEQRFDVIHVRWVLCFLQDPSSAIGRLAGLLAPGGRLVTLDYYNYLAFSVAPRIPEMASVVDAIGRSWEATGASLDVQGVVPAACADAGLAVRSVESVSGIARPGDARWHWPQSFLESYLPRLIDDGMLDEGTVGRFWEGWHARARHAGSFLFLPPILRVIAERSS